MKPFTTISATIFAIMAIIHAYRVATGFSINIAGSEIGQGVSWLGAVIAALLSYGLFREARR